MNQFVTLYNVPLYKKQELEKACQELELKFRCKKDFSRLVFEIKMERDSDAYDVIVGIFRKRETI